MNILAVAEMLTGRESQLAAHSISKLLLLIYASLLPLTCRTKTRICSLMKGLTLVSFADKPQHTKHPGSLQHCAAHCCRCMILQGKYATSATLPLPARSAGYLLLCTWTICNFSIDSCMLHIGKACSWFHAARIKSYTKSNLALANRISGNGKTANTSTAAMVPCLCF